MSVVASALRRFSRARSSLPFGDVFARVFDRWANALVVRDHGKGAPSYREGETSDLHVLAFNSGTLPDAPATTAPTLATGLLNMEPFGGICFYWKPDAASALVQGGTAAAGAAAAITLDAAASDDDDTYNGLVLAITAGTGSGQRRTITDYDGGTHEATVAAWAVEPDATSTYEIRASFPATHTSIDADVWALADTGDWLLVDELSGVEPYAEVSVPGTGYRQVYIQVTAVTGGLTGNLKLCAAGD